MPFLPSMLVLTLGEQAGQTTPTDPRSQRIRASRRGGQVLTRTQGPSNMNGLPDLRSLPDAPVPDGRTVLTNRTPAAPRRSWVTGGIYAVSYRLRIRSNASTARSAGAPTWSASSPTTRA